MPRWKLAGRYVRNRASAASFVAAHVAAACVLAEASAEEAANRSAHPAPSAATSAPSTALPALASFAGTWQLRIDAGGEIYAAELSLRAESAGLSGVYVSDGRRDRLRTADIRGQTLSATLGTRRFSRAVDAVLTAELIDGELRGEIEFDLGSDVRNYELVGKRPALQPSVESPPNASGAPTNDAGQSSQVTAPAVAQAAPTTLLRVAFCQGRDDYHGAVDAEIWAIAPDKPLLRQGTMTTDANNGGGESQVLMRFDGLFGAAPGQIPPAARIRSAKLKVVAFDPGTTVYLHRLLIPWRPSATWNSLASGIAIDDVEASSVRDGFTFGQINMDKQSVEFDVTQTVQRWSDGAPNFGWVFVNTGDNGWDFYGSDWLEEDLRPCLEVEFSRHDAAMSSAAATGDAN